MKRLVSKLTLVFLIGCINQNVWAFTDTTANGIPLYYSINSDGVTVTLSGHGSPCSGALVIPDSINYNGIRYAVIFIGVNAFKNCSGLTSITIPSSITSIGASAFADCSGLTSVTFNATNCTTMGPSDYPVFSNCIIISTLNIDDNVTIIPNYAFTGCIGLTSVNIPNGVTSIGTSAFADCSGLTSITIPSSVTSIGTSAFANCNGLTSVVFNAINCTTMGSYGSSVFSNCTNLTTLTIGDNVTIIPDYAFYSCSGLTSVTIPNSVTAIGARAFSYCSSLTSVTIPNSVSVIGTRAFYYCSSLTSFSIGNNITYIGEGVFSNCSGLTFVTIPNSVTSIGYEAFYNCSSLTSVTIPDSCTSIGGYAFENCTGLDTILMRPNIPPAITANTFQAVRTNVSIVVPCGTMEAYNEAAYWNVFTRIQEPDSCNSTLLLTVNNSLLGTVNGAGRYHPGTSVDIMAVPFSGKQFLRWNDANTDNPRTITISNDTSFMAIFDTAAAPTLYHNITVATANAAMGGAMGSGRYSQGTVATIVAVPEEGYAFSTWHDGSTINPRSITVSENNYYIASFVASPPIIQHDTTYIPIHDTTIVDNWIYDTAIVVDTLIMTEYVPVHDTTYIDVFVHDTTYIDVFVHDTTYIDVFVHDTTIVDNWIYDTTVVVDTLIMTEYVPVHDTTYIDVFVHDTTIVNNYIHDTTYLWQYDTTYIDNYIHDTTIVDNWIYDTTIVVDTLWLTQYDTVWLTLYDTLWLHDTVIVHDTIYITQEGIGDVAEANIKLYQRNGRIVVDGAAGREVYMYDINGRLLATKQENCDQLLLDVPASGAYLIKVGNLSARKVVVIRN